MPHNIYKRIEIREDSIAYRELSVSPEAGYYLSIHTLYATETFSVGLEPAFCKTYKIVC